MAASALLYIVGGVTLFILLLKLYIKYSSARCSCTTDLSGKTVIITGANTGIGYEVALDLARRNARVILACRNPRKATEACEKIRLETGNSHVSCRQVDVGEMKSVRRFAETIIKEEGRLDILINNAAIVGETQKVLTEDGNEAMFATNYLGPFLLTNLLLDLLKKSSPSRIINVSSVAHKRLKEVQFDNLNSEKRYRQGSTYGRTKVLLNLFTNELARRLNGTDITVNSLHPGAIHTDITVKLGGLLGLIIKVASWLFFKPTRDGAQTIIHCAVCPKLREVTGQYFDNCEIGQQSRLCQDTAVAKKLWEKTESLVGL